MMVRERGGRVHLLRTEYVPVAKDDSGKQIPGTGRGKQTIIGTFDRFLSSANEVDSMLLEQLTADERGQLDAWFQARQEEERRRSLSIAPRSAVRGLKELAANFETSPLDDEQIEEIKAAMSELLAARRAHKKRGR